MRAPTLAVGGVLAALLTLPAAAAPRVYALDQCADEFVMALSPRDAIVGLSKRADDADSYLAPQAAGLPLRRPTAESILATRPEVVVRYWGGDELLARRLAARGVKVVKIDDAQDFAGVTANVRTVAQALGQTAKGEALIARMNAQLAAAHGAWGGQGAIYLTSGGYTSGSGTLIDAMLRAAGLANLARRAGFSAVPTEALVLHPPSAVVEGFFDAMSGALQRWSPGRRQIVRRIVGQHAIVALPGTILGCPAWFAADGAARIAGARR